MYVIYFKDGTSFIFSSDTYEEIKQCSSMKRVFRRLTPHRKLPTYIHIDMCGIVTLYFLDETIDVSQIVAFDDEKEIIKW